jgi:hypothetical protein
MEKSDQILKSLTAPGHYCIHLLGCRILSCTFADMLVWLIPLQREIKKDGRRNAFDDLILLIVGHNFVLLFLQQEFSWFPDFPNLTFALRRRVPVVCNQSTCKFFV